MMQRNISYHISEDRLDRACYILTTVGLGEVVKERPCVDEFGRKAHKCVTNTGVILVFNEAKTKVITLYIATAKQIAWVYEGRTPSWLIAKARKNVPHVVAQENTKF